MVAVWHSVYRVFRRCRLVCAPRAHRTAIAAQAGDGGFVDDACDRPSASDARLCFSQRRVRVAPNQQMVRKEWVHMMTMCMIMQSMRMSHVCSRSWIAYRM